MTAAPTASNPAVALHARDAADRYARMRRSTILLVDDEEANLDLLEAVLGEAGYTQLVRTDDARAVADLAAKHAPDLVLLDLHMPHRHGLEVLADLRRATPEGDYRPVLVLTADVTPEARDYALGLGARDFVTKPFDTSEVLLRVENLLDTRLLHVDERAARERAEQAEARASLLAEWSGILAASVDPRTAAEHLATLVVPRWAGACEVRFGGASDAAAQASGSLSAPVRTSDGAIATLTLRSTEGVPLAADQGLVDELAGRLGLAAERARLLAAAELAARERERLLAVVAHDLRNPLGAVGMYAEMLRSMQPDDAADTYARRALATIHSSVVGMQRLVEDLLDAASLRDGGLRIHRVPSVVSVPFDVAERMLHPLAAAAGITLAVEPAPGASARVGAFDAERVVQLLSNLAGNAIKFTPVGGRVTMRYRADEHGVTASVIDTGPGVAPEDLPHLFVAYWRGDRRAQRAGDERRGAGLGLWIARAIVEAHGGELRVESRVGEGTAFHFTLPFAEAVTRWED
jgi:signal transduction histidine kinase